MNLKEAMELARRISRRIAPSKKVDEALLAETADRLLRVSKDVVLLPTPRAKNGLHKCASKREHAATTEVGR